MPIVSLPNRENNVGRIIIEISMIIAIRGEL